MSARSPAVKRGAARANPVAAAPRDELAVRVLRRFRSVFNAVKTHFQQIEKKSGIGGAQLWALSVIQARPGLGVNDLAAAMDIHQTTASNLAKSLVQLNMARTDRAEHDRRTVRLFVLPAGQRVLKKAPGPYAGVLPEALAGLEPATLARLEQDLDALLTRLGTDERAGHIPLGRQ